MNKKIFFVLLAALIAGTFVVSPVFADTWCHTFNTNLQKGDSGDEVTALQTALIREGLLDIPAPTGFFWTMTFDAVKAFQEKYVSDILAPLGLTQGTGKVASATRAKLNQLYGCENNNGSSNNGNNSNCTPDWSCGQWSSCSNSQKTRTCSDLNNCGVVTPESIMVQSCSATCYPNWSCGLWSSCLNNQQTRTCTDTNNCGTDANKPNLLQSCITVCIPNWSCQDWSACISGVHTRTCNDLNSCGTTNNIPATAEYCSSSSSNSTNNNTNNANSCQATCVDQSDGTYAISCSGYPTKCSTGYRCELTYSTSLKYENGSVQTIKILNGSECTNSCDTNWSCTGWSACSPSGQHTRTCTDSNSCGTTSGKPAESESCTYSCTPNWQTGAWSTCQNSQQTRTITDLNNCGTTANMPAITQSCTMPPTVDIKVYFGNKFLDGPIYTSLGFSSAIKWSSTDATSCTASGAWSGDKGRAGSISISNLNSPQTYTLTCNGAGGNATDSVTINPTSDFALYLKVNNSDGPLTLTPNDVADISWSTANATNCKFLETTYYLDESGKSFTIPDSPVNISFSNDVKEEILTSYSENKLYRYNKKVYEIDCEDNSGQTKSDSVTVNMDLNVASAAAIQFTANNSDNIMTGYSMPVQLKWSTTGMDSCTASGLGIGWSGAEPTAGTQMVTVPQNTSQVLALTCTGSGITKKASVKITDNTPTPTHSVSAAVGTSTGTGTGASTGTGTSTSTGTGGNVSYTTKCAKDSDCGEGWYCGCNFMDPKTYQYTCGVAPYYSPTTCMQGASAGTGTGTSTGTGTGGSGSSSSSGNSSGWEVAFSRPGVEWFCGSNSDCQSGYTCNWDSMDCWPGGVSYGVCDKDPYMRKACMRKSGSNTGTSTGGSRSSSSSGSSSSSS